MVKKVSFVILTKHYTKYQEGVKIISDKKSEFLDKLEPLKLSMNSIVDASQRGEDISEEKQNEFRILQDEAISLDNDFKFTINKMNTELSREVYINLSEIIGEWASNTDIDMIIDDNEVVYTKQGLDITDDILEVLKEKGLYI